MSRFVFTFFLRPIVCRTKREERKYVSLEVACFLTTDCTGRIPDNLFLNGRHLTHCGGTGRGFWMWNGLYLSSHAKREKVTCGGIAESNGCFSLLFITFLC